ELFAEVGPNFSRSYSSRSVSSEIGSECHLLWDRASRKSRSSPAASIVMGYSWDVNLPQREERKRRPSTRARAATQSGLREICFEAMACRIGRSGECL